MTQLEKYKLALQEIANYSIIPIKKIDDKPYTELRFIQHLIELAREALANEVLE